MEFDIAQLISHGTTQDVLLAIVALFLKSAVKLLHQIHSVFVKIESDLSKVVQTNEYIVKQNDRIADKVTVLEANKTVRRRNGAASPANVEMRAG